jgi:hypothetical protein
MSIWSRSGWGRVGCVCTGFGFFRPAWSPSGVALQAARSRSLSGLCLASISGSADCRQGPGVRFRGSASCPGTFVFPFGGSGMDPKGLDPSQTRVDRCPGLGVGPDVTVVGSSMSQLYASLKASSASFLASSCSFDGWM